MIDSPFESMLAPTDLYDETGILLISKGVPITREIYDKLQTRKILLPHQEPIPLTGAAVHSGHQIQHHLTGSNQDLLQAAAGIAKQAITAMQDNTELKAVMTDIALNQAWVFDHSVNIALLATLIALQLHLPEEEVFAVALGALLHDTGRTVTENTTTSFTLTNDDLVRSSLKHHPVIGSSLLQKAGLPESVCLVALQHHERFSGKGYPRGLRQDETHPHAQIVMMADVFEALTTRRLKQKTFTIAEGLAIVHRGRGSDFHPDILDALTTLLQR